MANQPQPDSNAAIRRSIYGILICIGLGAMIGRILSVDSVDSRKLADKIFDDEQKKQIEVALQFGTTLGHTPASDSVDFGRLADKIFKEKMAEKRKSLQQQHLSAVAIDYKLLQEKTEWAIIHRDLWRPFQSANDRSRWCTARALVEPKMRVRGAPYAIDNVIAQRGWDTIDKVQRNGHFYSSKPPLLSTLMAAEYWVIFHATGKSLATHPYEIGRFMLITINGVCLLLVFLFTARLVERLGTTDWGRILVMASCVFGTFLTTFAVTITNHLPAAACTAVLLDALVRIWLDGDRRKWTFLVAGFFAAMLAANEIPAAALSAAVSVVLLCVAPRKTLIAYLPLALFVTAAFFATNWVAVHSLKPAQMHRSPGDDWYDFPGSYWNNRQGIDQGEPSTAVYALHVLVGHHGIFSLTPVWCLSLLGGGLWLLRGERRLRLFALLAFGISMVCLGFYLWGPGVDRNYGGGASAFRWVFWMAPLWLVLMLPAADLLARRRWTRVAGLILLALSVLSASYPAWSPWTPPWIMNFMGYMGWLEPCL